MKEGRYVLLQRRALEKDLEGGKLDVSVGGHFRAGETLIEVLREAEEELGLSVQLHQIHHLATRRAERSYPHATDREVQEVYALRCDQPLGHYFLNCREVAVLYEVPLERAISLYRDGTFVPVAGFDCQQRTNNALLVIDDLIAQARDDTVEILKKLQGWLEGERDSTDG